MRKQRHAGWTLPILQLRDAKGDIIYDDRIDRLAVEESHIIELSVLYYNDPEPCFIHRGAVLSRAFGEIEAACGEDWTAIDRLDADLRKHLSMYAARDARLVREKP